ncbi:erg26, C-3 sterol dehydrogenase [Thoreauomyces humboldtii]|nr:erg26, C-3 sterol dehydrogenase [Thoreauomyces humboldtii]
MTASLESYLVIGGGGFLGARIVDLLLGLPNQPSVTIFDLRAPPKPDSRARVITGDITDTASVSAACKGIDVVIHTAAVIEGFPTPVYWKVNYEGTRTILEACRKEGVKKLVYTSSASVTYNGQDLRNGTEKDPYCTTHMDTYNETKAAAEHLVMESNGHGGVATVALRPAGIFGPNDNNASKGLYDAAKKGNWKFMIGDNSTLFDWTYVDNVAHAHILAAQNIALPGVSGEAFYITNDTPTFFWDVPKYLYNELGYKNTLSIAIPRAVGLALGSFMDLIVALMRPVAKLNPTFTNFRVKVITNNRYLDIQKAKRVLGYRPIISLEEGLARTAAFWKDVDRRSAKNEVVGR